MSDFSGRLVDHVDPPYTQHFMEIHVLTPSLWGFPAVDQAHPSGVQPNGPAATEACEASSSGHAAWEDAGAGRLNHGFFQQKSVENDAKDDDILGFFIRF